MLSPGEYTRRPALSLYAVRYGRLGVRQRRAVHRRYVLVMLFECIMPLFSRIAEDFNEFFLKTGLENFTKFS